MIPDCVKSIFAFQNWRWLLLVSFYLCLIYNRRQVYFQPCIFQKQLSNYQFELLITFQYETNKKKIMFLKKNNDYIYIHVRCDYFLYYFRVAKICHCSICSLRYHDNGFPKQQIYATMLTFTSVCINVCNITKMVILWAETPRYHFDSYIQLILCILYIIHLIFLQIPI